MPFLSSNQQCQSTKYLLIMNEVPFYTPCSLQIKLLYNPATTKYTSSNYYNNYYYNYDNLELQPQL